MSSNSGTGINGILPNNLFDSINHFLTNNKTLDFMMNRGKSDIPYGFMAIATFAAGTFTYVTYQDYANEISSGISETLDSIQSTELFIPSAQDNTEPLFSTSTENTDAIVNDDIIFESNEPSAQEEPEKKEEATPSAPEEPEKKEEVTPSAPEEPEKKNEKEPEKKDEKEPGEKYKMGGKSKKRKRKRKNKTKKFR